MTKMSKSWIVGIAIVGVVGLGALAYSHGMGGYGMMGNQGFMSGGYGYMGSMMTGYGHCPMMQHTGGYYGTYTNQEITKDVAENIVRDYLNSVGNPNLKQGKTKETEHDFEIEIVTKDNSLVEKLLIDKHTGSVQPTY